MPSIFDNMGKSMLPASQEILNVAERAALCGSNQAPLERTEGRNKLLPHAGLCTSKPVAKTIKLIRSSPLACARLARMV